MKNLLAILLGLFLLILVEGLLTLIGVSPLVEDDPFVGFSGSVPLFIPTTDNAAVYERNPAKKKYFNPQSFANPKPEETFRVISFGGSTTYGRPYLDDTSFSTWFDKLLERYDARLRYEHLNAGGISYASYRALRLMEELAGFDPDLYVVYSGHNEFLEERTFSRIKQEGSALRRLRSVLHRSRIYSTLQRSLGRLRSGSASGDRTLLGEGVSARLEQVGGTDLYHRDPDFRRGVIRQYRYTVEKMVDLAVEKDIPLILCTLPTNLSGVSPFKSEHRAGLTADRWWAWEQAFQRAEQLFSAGRYAEGLDALQAAEQIDAEYALLHYRKGQVLQMLGRTDEAHLSYTRAKEEDIVPLRALDEFNVILRDIASSRQIPLADVEAVFRRVSPDGIPGSNLFADHVHPTIEGQQLVAWVILDTAVKHHLVPLPLSRWQSNVTDARAYLRNGAEAISSRYRAMGMWGVGRLFFWVDKYPEAYQALHEAWQKVRDVPEIPMELGIIDLSRGNGEKALEFLRIADQLSPDNPNILLPLANAHTQTGQSRKALLILDGLGTTQEQSAPYHYARGKALLPLGAPVEGRRELEEAVRLAPEAAEYRADLAKALLIAGKLKQAQKEYRVYLQLTRHPDPQQAQTRWLRNLQDASSAEGGNR